MPSEVEISSLLLPSATEFLTGWVDTSKMKRWCFLMQLQHPEFYDWTLKEDQLVLEVKSFLEGVQLKVHLAM